ncbi:MCE family protein [Actinomadura craniellae]|uniref:MCE family protein n=1 Tax=Actinomadura craniellae TaxID=2231787 RepID=A0A365H9M2_9ACTN|nr:MlaD family protein [Actinomadura craniellae]RAY15844.1 MCE family protein [Actinomadura craniellae]
MALRSLQDMNRRVVAVVSISLLTVGCLFAFAAGQLRLFEGGYEMSGVFTETGGMKPGDDVRVAGVKVGRVRSVEPDFTRGHIVMTWQVDGGVQLGSRTRADIQTATLLGGRYLRLSGPVARPYMADLPADRRRVPLERTSVPFTVTDAIEGASELTGTLDQRAVDKLLDEVAKIETPDRQRLARMLRDFKELSTALNEEYPNIQALIANSKKITGTLAAKDRQLKAIVDNSQVLLRALVQRRNELAATIGQGNRTVRTLSQVIGRHERDLNRLLDNLHLVTARLAPNMDALNADLALLGPTFRQVANVRGNGPWVEGLMTGLGPLQPTGPHSTRRP